MLIFQPESYCIPARAFSLQLGVAPLGEEGSLAVARVSAGSCVVLADDVPALAVGDVLLLPFQATLSSVDGCSMEGIYLEGEIPASAARNMEAPMVLVGGAGGVDALLQTLLDDALQPGEASSLAYSLLCRAATAEAASRTMSQLVAAAVHMINESYGELYGVAELADELMVSKHHLIRCFSAEMEMSPGKYLASVRVENAKRLLLHRDFTLDVVAGMCGFSGANYMCKVFKQYTGETPASWRQRAARTIPPQPIGRLEEQAYL